MIRIEQLKKCYGGFSLECSLEVLPGRITGLVGQNGAGKSTTFKAVLGLIQPDGGNITVFGKAAGELSRTDKENLGVSMSNSGFSDYLTVKRIIPILSSMYKSFDREMFIRRCSEFGIPMDKRLQDFSTGMRAKLKVLVALSHKATLLVLDEPTAGLDVIARDMILQMLQEYLEEDENRSILISSHISSDLEGLCDDIYMIHNGRIVVHEETHVLLNEYGLLKLDEAQYHRIEKEYMLKVRREKYGYQCLTNQRQFYEENYPGVVIEKGNIDGLMLMMIKGEEVV